MKIYEFRVRLGSVNYRMLNFFHGRIAAVLPHGLTKENEVPRRDIELTIRRKRNFESDPERQRTLLRFFTAATMQASRNDSRH
jgi:hypothetical protein